MSPRCWYLVPACHETSVFQSAAAVGHHAGSRRWAVLPAPGLLSFATLQPFLRLLTSRLTSAPVFRHFQAQLLVSQLASPPQKSKWSPVDLKWNCFVVPGMCSLEEKREILVHCHQVLVMLNFHLKLPRGYTAYSPWEMGSLQMICVDTTHLMPEEWNQGTRERARSWLHFDSIFSCSIGIRVWKDIYDTIKLMRVFPSGLVLTSVKRVYRRKTVF